MRDAGCAAQPRRWTSLRHSPPRSPEHPCAAVNWIFSSRWIYTRLPLWIYTLCHPSVAFLHRGQGWEVSALASLSPSSARPPGTAALPLGHKRDFRSGKSVPRHLAGGEVAINGGNSVSPVPGLEEKPLAGPGRARRMLGGAGKMLSGTRAGRGSGPRLPLLSPPFPRSPAVPAEPNRSRRFSPGSAAAALRHRHRRWPAPLRSAPAAAGPRPRHRGASGRGRHRGGERGRLRLCLPPALPAPVLPPPGSASRPPPAPPPSPPAGPGQRERLSRCTPIARSIGTAYRYRLKVP